MQLVIALFLGLLAAANAYRPGFSNYIAVANRADGTVSLVNPHTLHSLNFRLPDNAEPMYVAAIFSQFRFRVRELWVGDRHNNRVVILKLGARHISIDQVLSTPRGPFHSLATQELQSPHPLVFTACDIDNVVVVHDVRSRRRVCKMQMPDIVRHAGGKPHDVTSSGNYAYVTFVGTSDGAGYVASYVARSCKLISVIKTAEDPHVAIRPGTKVFITAQGGELLMRSVPHLRPIRRMELPSPHGIFVGFRKRFLYVTNIAEGGKNAIVVIRVYDWKLVSCPQINTTFPTPHNPTLSFNGRTVYISHSIANKSVNSAWSICKLTGCVIPGTEKIFHSGLNPFGIAVVPPYQV